MMHPEERLAQRLVDGCLSGPEEREARARLARDKDFRALVERLRSLRECFAAGGEEWTRSGAPPGFSSRVAMAVRSGQAPPADLAAWSRRLSWAAAALLLLSLSILAGFRAYRGGNSIQADDLGRRYELLLQRARAREGKMKERLGVRPPAAERSRKEEERRK